MATISPMETVDVRLGHQGAPAGSLADTLLRAGFKLRLDLLPESEAPSAYHTDDPATLAEMQRLAASGGAWDWFVARLTLSDPASGLMGTVHLGACSGYTPESWFAPDGYWPDMVSEALHDLKAQAASGQVLAARLAKLEA